jgi:hypothetical protein
MRKALALLVFIALPASAADVSPGSWEITLETRVPAEPAFAPPPFSLTQCLTEADARDPSRVLGTASNPGATACTYTDQSYSGNTFTFSMQCSGIYGIKASGRVSFSADSIQGAIDSTANIGGKEVQQVNKISARRLGDC